MDKLRYRKIERRFTSYGSDSQNLVHRGEDDPYYSDQVHAETGYYWDSKHANLVAFAKMAVGAANGKILDDSVEGNLTP